MIKDNKKYSFAWVLAIYLIGVIVGGIYMGIVAPVRTVMQDSFTLSDESGIWVITIYSLFYAAFIPVIGKLADRYGRKRLFLICMVTFVIGSAICGFAGWLAPETLMTSMESYTTLLFGRILQAIGACGIIPLATAEIGVSAPPDKQGMYQNPSCTIRERSIILAQFQSLAAYFSSCLELPMLAMKTICAALSSLRPNGYWF